MSWFCGRQTAMRSANLALLVFVVLAASMAEANLNSLSKVGVFVPEIDVSARELGLWTDRIQNRVELRLREAGLEVASDSGVLSSLLVLQVDLLERPADRMHIYIVRLALREYALPARLMPSAVRSGLSDSAWSVVDVMGNRDVASSLLVSMLMDAYSCITYDGASIYGIAGDGNLYDVIMGAVDSQLDSFLNGWMKDKRGD